MAQHPPRISIIIPTHNRAALLARLLGSLARLTYPNWDAIVVDDGSSDTTAAVVEEYRRRGLPITYRWQAWSRMGAARNRGIEAATGDILAFTDDDCTVDPGWLDAIADAFTANPDALGVQGRTVTDHAAMTPFTRQVEQLEGGQPYRTCNIAYRSWILRDLGGFDPVLVRGEDVVMGARVVARGPIIFAPDAVVVHPPRPKEWAGRRAWRTLIDSEVHFKRTYPQYAPARSATLSVQKPEHVLSRWVLLPIRRYWRWHWAYFRRHPLDYTRQIPSIVREKLALFSLLPYFVARWAGSQSPAPAASGERGMGIAGSLPLISVVIPTRNRAAYLPALLAALDRQDYPHYEVIVVDDASDGRSSGHSGVGTVEDSDRSRETPDSQTTIHEPWRRGPDRRVLRLPRSAGSYVARNAGWRAARGEIIAFTDDDCMPSPGWLSGLARGFVSPDLVGVQGPTLAEPGTITPFTHQIEQTRPGPPYRTCNIAYRRQELERQGGFDERLRWYADNLLGLRAGPERIGFAADAVVFHPPRPREWRTRDTWRERFRADALYREELLTLGNYSRAAPPRTLPVILWILRPLVKQSWRHLLYLARHPAGYARQIGPMLREKQELLRALRADPDRALTPHDPRLPPLPAEPLVSAIVVTRAGPSTCRMELLAGTLTALAGQTWPRREVVVVAHGDGGPVSALARRWDARLVSCSGTLAAARQTGVDAASGEIIAFTDDDCVPAPDWMERAADALRRDPDLWGVQGRTVPEPGPPGTHAIGVDAPDPLYQTCNIAYRRDALDQAGGFDLAFDGWFEDTALGARVSARGAIGWNGDMIVTHRAVSRRPFDRATWERVLADERRLATRYPDFYRRVRGRWFLGTVLARWLVGSALKTLWRASSQAKTDPGGWLALAFTLLRERRLLLQLLLRPVPSEPRRRE